ncbi:glycosyl hydrolase family 18 protein [Photorhabdus sp. RW14-46]|uniref:glycosyl hydrolase family 18 protein n=1 Tax=Photorhabdus sp. RW14-46 TaxID=2100168 RepID=UPI0013F42010|nr:glycosyl hydrolase family 18 protein [Photorhabdus sp. RW14-46]NHB60380.1 chitinase [Photorhabdus sp. RW14-46]
MVDKKVPQDDNNLYISPDPGTKDLKETEKVWGAGAAEKTYAANKFDPATSDKQLSYTPGRVAKNLFNHYQADPNFQVFGYLTDWGIYDSRYGEFAGDTNVDYTIGGRGTDIMRLKHDNYPRYDKIIVGFAGIIGDEGSEKDSINKGAVDFAVAQDAEDLINHRGKVTFIDAWADVQAYLNCGFAGWVPGDPPEMFDPNKAQGILGALVKLTKVAKPPKVGLSLGGWTMSQAFHHIAKEPESRESLAESLKKIFDTFPMFTDLDLDWEYPGVEGAPGNNYGDEDAANYALLIEAVKQKVPHIKISIALNADPKKMEKANVLELIKAGVEGLNVMSYDFFGSPWAETLMHHTNLKRDPVNNELNSMEDAVNYLLGLNVNPKMIFCGFSAYSRNAQQAFVTQVSPLKGFYTPYDPDPEEDNTFGSFAEGVTEFPDLLRHYLDKNLQGKNSFTLYTDKVSDADFLYNENNGAFLSIETPRTVYEKAKFVKEKGLGGLFVWTIDSDNGLLVNAAREGLGGTPISPVTVNMSKFYGVGKIKLSSQRRRTQFPFITKHKQRKMVIARKK